jgi:hypothetical protein
MAHERRSSETHPLGAEEEQDAEDDDDETGQELEPPSALLLELAVAMPACTEISRSKSLSCAHGGGHRQMPWQARECCVFGSAGEGSSALRLVAFADVTAMISQRMTF